MKKSVFIFMLLLCVLVDLDAQSTERFIRIIGNSKHEFKSDYVRVNFSISEVAPNEYKKISYKPYDIVYSEFIQELSKLSISENDLVKSNNSINKYTKTKTKYFYLDVNDQNLLDGLATIKFPGYKLTKIEYLYKNIDPNIESDLALLAIKDAKRKAKKICDDVGMKLGGIINIVADSGGCCNFIKPTKAPTTFKTYNVTITFELID